MRFLLNFFSKHNKILTIAQNSYPLTIIFLLLLFIFGNQNKYFIVKACVIDKIGTVIWKHVFPI